MQAEGSARAEAVTVVAQLPDELSARVAQVHAGSPDDIVLVLDDGTRVRWGSSADGTRKAQVTQALLARSPRLVDVSAPDLPTTRGGARVPGS